MARGWGLCQLDLQAKGHCLGIGERLLDGHSILEHGRGRAALLGHGIALSLSQSGGDGDQIVSGPAGLGIGQGLARAESGLIEQVPVVIDHVEEQPCCTMPDASSAETNWTWGLPEEARASGIKAHDGAGLASHARRA
jgi:hypothetical protein